MMTKLSIPVRYQWLFLTWLAVSITGCVMPPKDEPRNTAIENRELGLSATTAPAVEAEWWKSFKDDQLNDLIAQMLARNPHLADALARVDRARAQLEIAQAGNQPGVSLDGDETYQRFAEHFIYPPPFADNSYWQGQLSANLTWSLDFWGRQSAVIRREQNNAQAALYDTAAARLAMAGAIAQAYVQFYRADAMTTLAVRAEQQRQAILTLTQHRVAAGLDNTLALRNAEQAVAQAQLMHQQADVTATLSRHELAALAGEGADAYASLGSPKLDLETALPLPDHLPADLLSRRPDVLAAKARVLAASAGREAAHQAFYPDVNLNAFAGFAAIGLGNLLRSDDAVYGAGPAIHLPLFESKTLKANYRTATAGLDAAIADYNNTVLTAVQQTADQLSLVQSTAQQREQSQRIFTSAEAAYTLAEKRYAAGIDNQLSVLNAETNCLNARQSLINILAARATARVALLLSVGGSFTNSPSSQDAHHD